MEGNPICLLPCYASRLQKDIAPKVVFMNGQVSLRSHLSTLLELLRDRSEGNRRVQVL